MKKILGSRVAFSLALAVCGSSACLASSDTIGIQGALQVGSNYVDFGNSLSTGGTFEPAPGSGVFQVTAVDMSGTLTSAGVTAGDMGTVQSLNEGTGSVTLPSAFITF